MKLGLEVRKAQRPELIVRRVRPDLPPKVVSAIGTIPCSIGLDIPGSTGPLQANSVVHFALNANPDRAGNPGATEATVAARVLG